MKITKQEALEIAKTECAKRGWNPEATGPLTIQWRPFSYRIWGGRRKGGNVIMYIRKKDGHVTSAVMTPL